MIKETQAKKLGSEVFGQFLAYIHNIYSVYQGSAAATQMWELHNES